MDAHTVVYAYVERARVFSRVPSRKPLSNDAAREKAKVAGVLTLRAIHDFEVALLDPCLAMTERGIRVDEARRVRMRDELVAARDPMMRELEATTVRDVLAPLGSVPKLLERVRVCTTCRNGKNKRVGCATCGGAGKSRTLVFNAASPAQVKLVLFDLLRLPKRTKQGKLSTDEESLKSLLAECERKPAAAALIRGVLRVAKLSTMAEIVERIAPGEDGRIRSVYNPAGTETGRFSSAETFLVRSTNLQNLPKREDAVLAVCDT